MRRKTAHALVALALMTLTVGPIKPGGISKPKGGQSAGRNRKVTPPRVAE